MAAQLGGPGRRQVTGRHRRVGADGRTGPGVARCRGDGRRHRRHDRCHPVGRGGLPAPDHRVAGHPHRRGRARNRHGRRRCRRLDPHRTGRAGGHRDRGFVDPAAGRHEQPRRNLAGADGGPGRHHRSAGRALVGVLGRAADRPAGFQGAHPRRIPEGHQGLRLRILRGRQDRGRQHRPAAADGARADLGGARARPYPRIDPARRGRRRVRRLLEQRLPIPGGVRPDRRAPLRDHRHRQLDHRQPGLLLLRLPRPLGRAGHRLLELAGRDAPGRAGAAQRRVRRGPRRRGQRAAHAAGDARFRRDRRGAGARRPDQIVLLGRRRLHPLRGGRHVRAQAGRRRAPRRRPDPGRHRRQRGQPRRPVQRPDRPQPGRAGRGAAPRVQGRRDRPTHRRLHRGARHRHRAR